MPLDETTSGPGRIAAVSRVTTARLSVYLRCLAALEDDDIATISSRQLAERFHLNSAQIRKDLAHFGEFGTRGVGYDVSGLRRSLTRILGLDRKHHVVILGAGHLGLALAGYRGFNASEFEIAAIFENDRKRVAMLEKEGWPVHHVDELESIVSDTGATIAVLAVPAHAGQQCLDRVARTGIRAVMSFVPAQLKVPKGIELSTVDLKIQLEGLAFCLAGGGQDESDTD
jgi:redox-sensing transcriptional repressor